MIYNTSIEIQKQRAIKHFKTLIKVGAVISICEDKPVSTNQIKYLLLSLALFGFEVGYSIEEVKQNIYKKLVNPNIFYYKVYDAEKKKYRHCYKSIKQLNSLELTKSIDKFRDFASMELNIYLPRPEEKEKLKEVNIMLKNNSII